MFGRECVVTNIGGIYPGLYSSSGPFKPFLPPNDWIIPVTVLLLKVTCKSKRRRLVVSVPVSVKSKRKIVEFFDI